MVIKINDYDDDDDDDRSKLPTGPHGIWMMKNTEKKEIQCQRQNINEEKTSSWTTTTTTTTEKDWQEWMKIIKNQMKKRIPIHSYPS